MDVKIFTYIMSPSWMLSFLVLICCIVLTQTATWEILPQNVSLLRCILCPKTCRPGYVLVNRRCLKVFEE